MSLRFVPLPAPLPDVDTLPEGAVRTVTARDGGYPCRRCLRDAAVGDVLTLLPYDPFLGTSPYRQPGPVYVHAEGCAPDAAELTPGEGGPVPRQLASRQVSVRAFTDRHLMVDAAVTDGADLGPVAERLLAASRTAYLHVHFAAPGCFAVRVERG